MKKLVFLFTLVFVYTYSTGQNYGVINGLSYKHDYQKDIDNLMRQEQLDYQNRQLYEARLQAAKAEQREKAKACANQIKELYPTLGKYPDRLNDGWYNVAVTNYYDMCGERKVYVQNNRITKYFIDNYAERSVSFSSPIIEGKAHIKLFLNGADTEIHDVYFLDYIIDPTISASKPSFGKYTFYTTFKRAGTVKVYIDGMYAGILNQYFDPKIGTPYCGQESSGTITFSYKPGTYNFIAEGTTKKWSGKITIDVDGCGMMNLKN